MTTVTIPVELSDELHQVNAEVIGTLERVEEILAPMAMVLRRREKLIGDLPSFDDAYAEFESPVIDALERACTVLGQVCPAGSLGFV